MITVDHETTESPTGQAVVHRIEVFGTESLDPAGQQIVGAFRQSFPDVHRARTARIYLIEAAAERAAVERIAAELLTDPVNQSFFIGASDTQDNATLIEVHYQPGVMDPVAQSTQDAIEEMLPDLAGSISVTTGHRYDFIGCRIDDEAALRRFAEQHLGNPVIQDIHFEPFHPDAFPHGHPYHFEQRHVLIRELDDDALTRMSREAHLFLSLAEMQAVRDYYRGVDRDPTDIELETLAQTWSEHCVHKTLKSTIRYSESHQSSKPSDQEGQSKPTINWNGRPGHIINEDGSVTIHNLLKSTIAAATEALMAHPPHNEWCISVFKDNAGIVKFDHDHAVCIKVETHNHPSAIEPYGGAATGIGGCIRDVMGTGLSARPIANTDVFAVASPNTTNIPKGVLHPKRVLERVVAGVRDYGNRMGIPTVNGAVVFHQDYLANPLVFAGCIGVMPLDKCFGDAQPGDRIIALGGATGRDGIHGATFSSSELTDTHADEFSHAVQIGNAITQKKTMDVILQARDHQTGCLFSAITDCGAGGFSSAVGEMGEKVGACVQLENAPLKYAGLSYTEIWISEAQERMVLAVPPGNVETLRAMCEAENVPFCDLGQFGWNEHGPGEGDPLLVLTYQGTEVGRLSMTFLHDGIPTPTRDASWGTKANRPTSDEVTQKEATSHAIPKSDRGSVAGWLHGLLTHPDIASKHWIIRQYDHEVQGGSAVKPLVGPQQIGPSDAAVVRPVLSSNRGVAIASGLAPHFSESSTAAGMAEDGDSYWMALAAIDEAVRNAVCVGADPSRIAILDNFCWPGCDDPQLLGSLVRAAEACYDGAIAYRTPFISGKDSLNNQFTTEDGRRIAIPPTLLITALGIVRDVTRCVTMDAKQAGSLLIVVGDTDGATGGSHYRLIGGRDGSLTIPKVDLNVGPRNAAAVHDSITQGMVRAAHDCSDGGLLVAVAEMAFAGGVGLDINLANLPGGVQLEPAEACFAETPSRYLLEVPPTKLDIFIRLLNRHRVRFGHIGTFTDDDNLTLRHPRHGQLLDEPIESLRDTWRGPLDW